MSSAISKGFIFPSLYIYLGLGAIVLILGIAVKIQTSRLVACKSEFATFKSEVERLGLEAKAKVKQQEAQDKLNKEKADEDLRKLRSVNADLSKRLRDNAGSRFLPRPETVTGESKGACNADLIDGAIREFVKGTTELIIEGQSAVDSLNNAKRWSQSQ